MVAERRGGVGERPVEQQNTEQVQQTLEQAQEQAHEQQQDHQQDQQQTQKQQHAYPSGYQFELHEAQWRCSGLSSTTEWWTLQESNRDKVPAE